VRDSDEQEFYEQLDALLDRARNTGDVEFRLLVKQYAALRRTTGWLLDELDKASDPASLRGGEIARLARFLVSSERRGG
jgi:hypothetical protein